YVLEVIVCLFLILVVLLQQGSGADLSVFGGGATQTAFGARGTTQFIHKLTVWAFVAFILLTLAIAVYKGGTSGSSVITGADPKELQAPAKPTPAPAVPPASARTLPIQPAAPAQQAPATAPAQAPAPQPSAPAPQ
ncbi:MAG TPA: preprotein translocase subunit SecG, partial [Thermoanaerobaculia bacterium]|nr:preprotein translocase subunit SecG [Thermoanaerobaculia bacterium]